VCLKNRPFCHPKHRYWGYIRPVLNIIAHNFNFLAWPDPIASPRITDGPRFRNQDGQPFQKIFAIKIVSKNLPAYNPAIINMMQYTGGI
jgi:hypothetical protein